MNRPGSRFALIVAALLAIAAAGGCASLEEMRNAKGTGRAQTFDAEPATVWNALLGVLAGSSLTVAEENRPEGYLIAERRIGTMPYGERLAMFVEPAGPGRTRVEIVNRALPGTIVAHEWAPELFRKLQSELRKAR